MPNVLNNSKPSNPGHRWHCRNKLLAILAFTQALFWFSPRFPIRNEPIPGDKHLSTFTLAWQLSHYSFFPSLIESILTFSVAAATLLPPAQRRVAYFTYLFSVPVSLALSLASLWFLQTQLPGAWRTLLSPHNSGFYDPLSTTNELVRLCDPLFWILILRLIIPSESLVGEKTSDEKP